MSKKLNQEATWEATRNKRKDESRVRAKTGSKKKEESWVGLCCNAFSNQQVEAVKYCFLVMKSRNLGSLCYRKSDDLAPKMTTPKSLVPWAPWDRNPTVLASLCPAPIWRVLWMDKAFSEHKGSLWGSALWVVSSTKTLWPCKGHVLVFNVKYRNTYEKLFLFACHAESISAFQSLKSTILSSSPSDEMPSNLL